MAFGNARYRKCFPDLDIKDVAKSRRDLKVKLRKIRKMSKEHIRNLKVVKPDAAEYVPISLSRRCVLRSGTTVDVRSMSQIHKLFMKEESLLNGMIAAFEDDSTYDEMGLVRMALKSCREEALKWKGQSLGVFQPDPGFDNGQAQELYEQFYQEHGLPNDAEKALLSQVGGQSDEHIDGFFTSKESRLVAVRVLKGLMYISMLRNLDTDTLTKAWKPKKPFGRH